MISINKFDEFCVKNKNYILIVLLILNFIITSTSVVNESVTYDEVCYAGTGTYILKTGDYSTLPSIGHAVLPLHINSIFLNFLDIDKKVWKKDCWDRGPEVIFNSGYDFRLITFLIRLPFMLISLLLAFYVYKWSTELYGLKAGFLSLFLYLFNPVIISTSRLALTDLAAATFFLIATYYFWRFNKKPSLKNLFLTGLFIGLTFLTKEIAVFLIPTYVILIMLNYKKISIKKSMSSLLLIGIITFLLIFLAYGFQIGPIASSVPTHYKDRAIKEINNKFSNNIELRDQILYIFHNVSVPAPAYIASNFFTAYHSDKGIKGYFFGEISEVGQKWWYYYPVLVFIKTPIPTIILFLLSLLYFRKIKGVVIFNELHLIIPFLINFLFFMFNQQAHSVRQIIVIFPYLFIFTGKIVNIKVRNKKTLSILLLVLLIWNLLSVILAYPAYTTYFNEFVGGPKNGHKYLLSDNLDIGQDLIRLKNFMDRNNIDKINLSYYGGIDPIYYRVYYDAMPTACFVIHANQYYEPFAANCQKKYFEDCRVRTGIVAISATNLHNRFLKNTSCFNWLKNYEPIDRLGNSIFVYNITS